MFVEPMIVSLIIGKIRRGKIRNLEYVQINGWYLFIIAGIIQLLLSILKKNNIALGRFEFGNYFIYIHGLSYILMIICIILNIKKHSMKLFLIGIILNFIVIFTNGGQMPVSLKGIKDINENVELSTSDYDIKHRLATKDTKLIYLSDIIVIPKPYPVVQVISVGDIFIMGGLFLFLQEAMVLNIRK